MNQSPKSLNLDLVALKSRTKKLQTAYPTQNLEICKTRGIPAQISKTCTLSGKLKPVNFHTSLGKDDLIWKRTVLV